LPCRNEKGNRRRAFCGLGRSIWLAQGNPVSEGKFNGDWSYEECEGSAEAYKDRWDIQVLKQGDGKGRGCGPEGL